MVGGRQARRAAGHAWPVVLLAAFWLAGCGRPPAGLVGEAGLPPRLPTAFVPATPLAPVAGARTAGDPYAPELGNGGYFVRAYDLRLALDPNDPLIIGEARIDAITAEDGLAELSLDFVGFDIRLLTVDGAPAAHRRVGAKLVITLPEPLPAGRPFALRIAYDGQPVREPSRYVYFADAVGLIYPGNGTIYTLNQPNGAHYWFPANDHPRDKATFRFTITVPAGLTAVANGRLLAEQGGQMPDGRPATTFLWGHDFPMAPYLALVAVGDYERLDDISPEGVRLRHYIFPTLVPGFERTNARLEEALAWFSEYLGPYPFESFGYVTASIPRISMETQTMVLLSEGMVSEEIMVHEMSHMWFGDWVSVDSWADMWRNEGFATYMALLWLHRDDPENLELALAAMRAEIGEQAATRPLNALPPEDLFGFDSYIRGAILAHELHTAMGDDAFFGGLRAFFAQYGGAAASHADFQAVMERAAGRDLDGVFAPWLAPTAAPSPAKLD